MPLAPTQALSDNACCLGCGYLLRGLDLPTCPECGRGFEPSDSKTFAHSPSDLRGRRIKRHIPRFLVWGLIIFAMAPRGRQFATLEFDCLYCREFVKASRWQLFPPRWMPRYPGYTWSQSTPGNPAKAKGIPCRHEYVVRFGIGNTITETQSSHDLVTQVSAEKRLKAMMEPCESGGIQGFDGLYLAAN